jgi:hypothetical protein
MDHPLRHDGRRRRSVAAAVVLVAAGAVTVLLGVRAPAGEPPEAPARTVTQGAPSASAPSPSGADAVVPGTAGPAAPAQDGPADPVADLGPVLPAADPVALDIPAIGVHADTLVPLALDADGVLPAPADYALPGWYTGGPNPGQFGPAVIAGHVDGPDGPAVFYRLGELTVGAQVQVTRDDGTVATFSVDSVERYAKADFPTSRVYGNTTDRAELRLITCGGAFDRTTGHYVDNIVVFAHLVA